MENLRDIRRRLGLTQIELGEQLGLDQSTISKFETGALSIDKRTELALTALIAAHGGDTAGNGGGASDAGSELGAAA